MTHVHNMQEAVMHACNIVRLVEHVHVYAHKHTCTCHPGLCHARDMEFADLLLKFADLLLK